MWPEPQQEPFWDAGDQLSKNSTVAISQALLRDTPRMQQMVEWFATIAEVGDSNTPATRAASTIG